MGPSVIGRVLSGAFLTIAIACIAGEAWAQYRSGTPGGGFPGGGMRGSRGGGEFDRGQRGPAEQRPAEDSVNVTDYRLELLHVDLKLTPAQEPLWKTYAERVSALASDIARERARTQSVMQMKALQRIDQSVDAARNRLTALEDIAAAAKSLYGSLSVEQQALADLRLATTLPQMAAPLGGPAPGSGPGPGGMPRPPQ